MYLILSGLKYSFQRLNVIDQNLLVIRSESLKKFQLADFMPVVIARPVAVEGVSRTKGVAMIAVTSKLITFLTRFFPCFTPTLSLWTRESKRFQNLFSGSPFSGLALYFFLLSSNSFSQSFFQIKISEKKSLKKILSFSKADFS